MTLGENILEEHRIIEVKILEVGVEVIIEMTTLEEVEVDPRKDNIKVILEGITEAVPVGQDQIWEPVIAEIGLDVWNVGNMIILLKTVQIHQQKKSQNRYNKCIV